MTHPRVMLRRGAAAGALVLAAGVAAAGWWVSERGEATPQSAISRPQPGYTIHMRSYTYSRFGPAATVIERFAKEFPGGARPQYEESWTEAWIEIGVNNENRSRSITLSPDGQFLYESLTSDGSLTVRRADGQVITKQLGRAVDGRQELADWLAAERRRGRLAELPSYELNGSTIRVVQMNELDLPSGCEDEPIDECFTVPYIVDLKPAALRITIHYEPKTMTLVRRVDEVLSNGTWVEVFRNEFIFYLVEASSSVPEEVWDASKPLLPRAESVNWKFE